MDIAVGKTFGPSGWRQVTQDEIDAFARISGDRQWIHTDVERARRESPFGTTIAHGNLTLSLVDGFRDELVGAAPEGTRLGVNLGYDRVRFPAPVRAGARVRARMEITSVDEREDGWVQVTQRFTIEVEDEAKPACVADSVVRVLRA
ncbi:MAG: MaoC family dehydratase [Actinomycetota bacterium]|nr:MaoC family dehydratase [Actinomycetota bacterium]MDQ5807333.1 MaoC family dehydratase [Actinomycetota bacterium]